MKNLDQIRAANALNASRVRGMGHGQKGGDALSGFAMLIKTNGLLAAVAFAAETKSKGDLKQEGANLVVQSIARHLSHADIKICTAEKVSDFADELARGNADLLRRATAEALAYLNYLKRFTP